MWSRRTSAVVLGFFLGVAGGAVYEAATALPHSVEARPEPAPVLASPPASAPPRPARSNAIVIDLSGRGECIRVAPGTRAKLVIEPQELED